MSLALLGVGACAYNVRKAGELATLSTEATHVTGTQRDWTYPSVLSINGRSTYEPPLDRDEIRGNRFATFEMSPGEKTVTVVFVRQSGNGDYTWPDQRATVTFDAAPGHRYALRAAQTADNKFVLTVFDKNLRRAVPYRR